MTQANTATCRELLGDDQLPSCGRCSLLDSECVRGLPFPFKHANNPLACEELGDSPLGQPRTGFEFGENQVWVETPTSGSYILVQVQYALAPA